VEPEIGIGVPSYIDGFAIKCFQINIYVMGKTPISKNYS
jgi:hypothetical protein